MFIPKVVTYVVSYCLGRGIARCANGREYDRFQDYFLVKSPLNRKNLFLYDEGTGRNELYRTDISY